METHTITTYSLANEAFLRTYFPECVWAYPFHKVQKEKKLIICYLFRTEKAILGVMPNIAFLISELYRKN